MNKNFLLIACVSVVSCSLVSCGTIGGMGKDLQYVGEKMEVVEHRRIFKPQNKVPQNNSANLDIPIPPMGQDYPVYPVQ